MKFQCQWLLGFGDTSHRPDKTKIVLDYVIVPPDTKVFQLWEVTRGSAESKFAQTVLDYMLGEGYCVAIIPLRGNHLFFIPNNTTVPEELLTRLRAEGASIISHS